MQHRLELVLRFVFEIFLSTGLFAVIFGAAFGLEKLVDWLHVHGLSPELAFIARIGEFILLAADLTLYVRTLWVLGVTYWREVHE